MRVNLYKIWPTCVLVCIAIGFIESELRFFWFFSMIWLCIGYFSYSSNGLIFLKNTLKENLLFWVLGLICIGFLHVCNY